MGSRAETVRRSGEVGAARLAGSAARTNWRGENVVGVAGRGEKVLEGWATNRCGGGDRAQRRCGGGWRGRRKMSYDNLGCVDLE